jgi:hypothetical protein
LEGFLFFHGGEYSMYLWKENGIQKF